MRDLFSKESFEKIYESSNRTVSFGLEDFQIKNESLRRFDSAANSRVLQETALDSQDSNLPIGPQEEYSTQSYFRQLYGKKGLNTGSIASHPDFIDLVNTTILRNQYICTIFVDIKGSTRLSLLYPLHFIHAFKNSVLRACIEVVRSFDGHVHRLMGDALMAFFGDARMEKEQAIADTLNCVLMLRLYLQYSIKPWLKSKFPEFDELDFGFRIGCNFGDDHEVLWGNYGYGVLGEFSPTGFPIDLASKLQGLASKNDIMLGQGLLDFVNWPEEYSRIKTIQDSGVQKEVPFVLPNYKDHQGVSINYKMRVLDFDNAIRYLPLNTSFKKLITNNFIIPNQEINYKCYIKNNSSREEYISGSRFLEKSLSIVFSISVTTHNRIAFPLKVIFTKKNNGPNVPVNESQEIPKTRYINKTKQPLNRQYPQILTAELEEGTSYRGLHTMTCVIKDDNDDMIFRDVIAVMIK